MFVGAWGEEAIALLSAGVSPHGTPLERFGSLAMTETPSAIAPGWRCWVAGRLVDSPELSERFDPTDEGSTAMAVAHAHARLGAGAAAALRGSFIVVAAHSERGIALVSRDQLGGRPLVYVTVGRGALFAEHDRDLLQLLPRTPDPDRLTLTSWVQDGVIPEGRSFYEGFVRVPPGHRLVLSDGPVSVERFWAPHFEGTARIPREEVVERLRDAAFAAVGRATAGARLPAVRLSGGLDSACVAAALSARGESTKALAIGAVFPAHPETDERELIEATARYTNLTLEKIGLDPRASMLASALCQVERWRLPSVSSNFFVWEPAMALARERGVDAMLDGEGGDELFGLTPQLIADFLRRGRLIGAWGLSGRIPGIGDPDPRTRLRVLRVFGLNPLAPPQMVRRRRRRRAADPAGSLLSRRDRLSLASIDREAGKRELDGPLWWRALASELITGGEWLDASGLLRRDAVAGGVDRRHPFLFDLELLTAVLSTPPELQFDPVRDRVLLREALAGRIPEQVRGRFAKSYFTPLLMEALLGADGDRLVAALAESGAPIREFVEPDPLARLLRRSRPLGGGRALTLWRTALVDAWLRGCEQR
jgi:asparagine synthase (glutamine-hydrolysing)